MKTTTKFQKGFTVIELMIAAAAGAILILAAGMVIVTGQTSWTRTWTEVNIQRDASYAMLLMTRSIQAAADANFSSDGKILYIPKQSDPNVIKFTYKADTNDLQCQVGGGTVQTVIAGEVYNLQFSRTAGSNNTIKIDLSMKKDKAKANFKSTVMIRNY